ncbi:hypothetical protein V7068_14435 [Bacillus sp. JJ634]
MKNLFIVGGQQKEKISDEWHQYEKGVIVKLDTTSNHLEKCLEYVSPKEACPPNDSSIVFKAGTVQNRQLYVCTQTEVLIYSLPDFKLSRYLSLPCFNDVHHVRPTKDGNLLVVNTGLDMVMKITKDGHILQEWNVLGQKPWERFSRTIDYRKVPTTKPHQSHPNFVFQISEDIWVTRCLQYDAICLTRPNQQIDIGGAFVHDGVVFGDTIYFTKMDGHVVTVDIHSLKIKKVFNLFTMTNTSQHLGWCRGIKVLNKDTVIVGFSRLRPYKKLEENGQFVWEGSYGSLPTRIACYNLIEGKLLWEHNLEQFGLNAVFSIHCENE